MTDVLYVCRPTEDDLVTCMDCGDEIEDGHEIAYEPVSEAAPMSSPVHSWCAVMNGYRLIWPGSVEVSDSDRSAIALALRDWMHEQPSLNQCNGSSDTCDTWPLAYEVRDHIVRYLERAER
jgi:hypothetical protein